MLTEEERNAINERVKNGIMPTDEEMQQLLEYAKAEAIKTIEAQGVEMTCPHCLAPIPMGTLTCEYCGSELFAPDPA